MIRFSIDPTFCEEAVTLVVRELETQPASRLLARRFYLERDHVYEQAVSDTERDEAFRAFYHERFHKLGLEKLFRRCIAALPFIVQAQPLVYVKQALGEQDEGVELFHNKSRKTVFIRVCTKRVVEPAWLRAFLRHELFHISDMFDPAFQYLPHRALGGASAVEDELIRERFRLLWNIYVDARMRRKKWTGRTSREQRKSEFNCAFALWDEDKRKQSFQDLFARTDWTQATLIRLAQDERLRTVLGEGGLRCPLCQFSSYDRIENWEEEAQTVAQMIKQDYPMWTPHEGACIQCYELYRAQLKKHAA